MGSWIKSTTGKALLVLGIAVIALVSAVIVLQRGQEGVGCGSLTAIVGVSGTPSVGEPVYHGQQTRVNITAYGEPAGNIDAHWSIPGATATLVVNGTSSGSTTLDSGSKGSTTPGTDSEGYVYYVFPGAGSYSVHFKLSYNEIVCYSHDTKSGNSTSIVVAAR